MTAEPQSGSAKRPDGTKPSRLLRRPAVVFLLSIALSGSAVGTALWLNRTPSLRQQLRDANQALNAGRYEEAERAARNVIALDPESAAALLLAARAAKFQDRPRDAVEYVKRIPEGTPEFDSGLELGVELTWDLQHPAEAEAFLTRFLKKHPQRSDVNNRLAYLLGVEGRGWEMRPYLINAIRMGTSNAHHLVLLGANEPIIDDPQLVANCRKSVPDGQLILLGTARKALGAGQVEQAIRLLRPMTAAFPELYEAQARLGTALVDGDAAAFLKWHRQLPAGADRHPQIWTVRGLFARKRNQPAIAARCFWEAIKRNPNDRIANYQLSLTLASMKDERRSRPFAQRALTLQKLAYAVDRIYDSAAPATGAMRDAASLTESLGRFWEATAWARAALVIQPGLAWPREALIRLNRRLSQAPGDASDGDNPALAVDLSALPRPDWNRGTESTIPRTHIAGPRDGGIRFVDDAEHAGLNFVYHNGARPGGVEQWIIESNGGGVAVLDYDGDLRPDVYFTQGGDWPVAAGQRTWIDQLFRNRGDGRFENVTLSAGLENGFYGQGCTVGDFNGDGFPDLYVANIGRNRLYRNNGDGTFSDVTAEAGLVSRRWTASCLMADLDGDGLPEIYDVNYLQVDLNQMLVCRRGSETVACGPSRLHAADDQLYHNRGDGTFSDVSREAGIIKPDGKGLGIVAADIAGRGALDLFVANDSVPNFLFRRTSPPMQPLRFQEAAVATGLAVDGDGLSQACMGVALGDADGDGRPDLFVTNYEKQSNTLYLQRHGGFFDDTTRSAGLRGPSYAPLGFGTQFLDADLDGWHDLVVTNGHVYEFPERGRPAAMRPQFFRNLGGGRFAELNAKSTGPFFRKKRVGRGLARLDWNGDGRPDFIVSHMNAPAALLTNRTRKPGNYLALQLRGVTSNRDAIGSIVTVRAGKSVWTQQLAAGDGYQASNQRELIFGLGSANSVDELSIRWLSGARQTFRNIEVNQRLLLVEGGNRLFRVRMNDGENRTNR